MIGTGPGDLAHLTPHAKKALEESEVVVGYNYYLTLLKPLLENKKILGSGMKREIERGHMALKEANTGKTVAVISSGDPGVYGMAGVIWELIKTTGSSLEVEVVPGVTAATAAAALLGAPLMHDFAVISLSDLLTPWETIKKRIEAAAVADFVTVIYNPKSIKRTHQIEFLRETFLKHRDPHTPVGIVKNAYRPEQEIILANLHNFTQQNIDMFSIVVIGNAQTYQFNDKLITPRGYRL
ncbi:precorrin-3B C(17)-methyltransferase [Thermanaerosceptrum fracticalcis]|uniref:Precorrin-3B C(17)-methyltransferase n=1 Tax=Thermanaerosceptrum fracticalcis TaxID=1712410 RepID=A0A7G6E896_THEFR|nr:precorrin-3B C(17)-methyltransferase [Thermanaerosceptrum fracticalcis]